MKRPLWLPVLALFWIVLVGMSIPPRSEVPRPEIDFRATVRDDQGIATKLSGATWEGEVFFSGTRGKGSVTIPFEKVKSVRAVGTGEKGKKDFQVTLKSGDVVAVSFNEGARFSGTTSFGTYSIIAKNLKEIVFEKSRE